MKIIISVSCFVFLSISALVFAHGGATGVVKERMDLMENLKGAMKSLKPIMRGQKDYEVDTVKKSALVIRDNAGEHMTKLFPEGSLKKPSEATPEIWSEWEEFQRLANNLERLGQALHEAADNDQPLGPQGGMGGPGMMGDQDHMRGNGMMGNPDHMRVQGMMGNQARGSGMGPGGRGGLHGLENMSDEHLASMPAAGLFRMIGQNCAACHKQYRVEK